MAHYDVIWDDIESSNARSFNARRVVQVRASKSLIVSVGVLYRACDLLSPNHESYTRRRCEGPMEGRSIIHKMHVLERSFLPELKYSTSHSYRPLLHPGPIPGGLRLSMSSTEYFLLPSDTDTQPRHCRPPSTLPFTPIPCPAITPYGKSFLSLAGATRRTFSLYELARSTGEISRQISPTRILRCT